MFKFAREQKIIEIGDVKIGGQVGENPTVLIPTIFYDGHKIVDAKNNKFDESKAEALIREVEEVGEKHKLPFMFQVVGLTPELMKKGLDFVADRTKAPIIIDSADKKARLTGLEHASKNSYASRTMYNAINMMIDSEETSVLTESKIEGVIILGFNMQDPSVKARIALLEDGGGFTEKGLLTVARECGFENILYDPGVQPFGQGAGSSFRLLSVVKARYGLPTGVGAHNIPSSWAWLRKNAEKEQRRIADISANTIGITAGANSLFIGPIENAKYAAPAVAMTDILMADSIKDFGIAHSELHPYQLA
jgi:tetrahydromethanopterin S-methyltransferase subunit H